MKSYITKFSLLLAMVSFFACKKVENKIHFESGTSPVLTASTAAVRLEPGEETNTAITLKWTNPEYKFTTGISSQDVKYTLELDTLGGNFSSGKKYTTVFAKDLVKAYTVAELNGILGNTMLLQLEPRRTYSLQARITSSLGINTNAVPLTSNTIAFTVKPFTPPPKIEAPGTSANNYNDGNLWIVGDASFGGWNNPLLAPYDVSQKFTKVSKTLYQITVALPGGGGYKLVQAMGVWGTQYHMTTGTWASGEFEKKDSDPQFPGPPSAGTYKITVDFQFGVYTAVKQ